MFKFIEKITKKVATTASITFTDTTKKEAKQIATDALPTLLGLGGIAAGLLIFKNSAAGKRIVAKAAPTVCHTVTNYYFFDEGAKADLVEKILERSGL